MGKDFFEVIILIGRPAAGKSEVIDYVKKLDREERIRRFHISDFKEVDDFPFIWEKFEEDDIFTKYGRERIYTDEKLFFKDPDFMWTFFIEKINLDFAKKVADDPEYFDKYTTFVEFARGGEKGFETAFNTLSEDILKRAGIVYIKVSYEESCRKNKRRYRKDQEHSILYHSLGQEKMELYYRINDWENLSSKDPEYINIKGLKVPYVVFENEPEKTLDPELLGPALDDVLGKLWKIYNKQR